MSKATIQGSIYFDTWIHNNWTVMTFRKYKLSIKKLIVDITNSNIDGWQLHCKSIDVYKKYYLVWTTNQQNYVVWETEWC